MSEVFDLIKYQQTVRDELTVENGPEGQWGCMDDRPPDASCNVISGSVYNQLAGGAFGLGNDIVVLMEYRTPKSFVYQAKPIYVMGSLAATLAKDSLDADICNHGNCAAQLGALSIGETIVEHPDEVFESALLFKPDLDDDDLQRTVEAYTRIISKGLYIDPKKSLELLERGKLPKYMPVPVASLAPTPHQAVSFIADYRERKALKVSEANQRNVPSYYTSFGNLSRLCEAIGGTLPIDFEGIATVQAIRLGAIRAKHLLGKDGQLPVILLAETA